MPPRTPTTAAARIRKLLLEMLLLRQSFIMTRNLRSRGYIFNFKKRSLRVGHEGKDKKKFYCLKFIERGEGSVLTGTTAVNLLRETLCASRLCVKKTSQKKKKMHSHKGTKKQRCTKGLLLTHFKSPLFTCLFKSLVS